MSEPYCCEKSCQDDVSGHTITGRKPGILRTPCQHYIATQHYIYTRYHESRFRVHTYYRDTCSIETPFQHGGRTSHHANTSLSALRACLLQSAGRFNYPCCCDFTLLTPVSQTARTRLFTSICQQTSSRISFSALYQFQNECGASRFA